MVVFVQKVVLVVLFVFVVVENIIDIVVFVHDNFVVIAVFLLWRIISL